MNELVYPRERTLGVITLVLGLLVWVSLILGTFGVALLVLGIGFILYLFAQSMLIAHIRGNGVELSASQFPELYAQFAECCDRLDIKKRPEAFILNGNGGLNAFATKFLGTQYVVLYSDVVDAMDKHADGVRFYIGHELGHLRMKHLNGQLLRWPVLWLPLLGAAYARARETTCDRHGRACSSTSEGAARALAALASGGKRWQTLDLPSYVRQTGHTSGFWMSFHELVEGYPWLTKRAARVIDPGAALPSRNFFSYLLAMFVPYAGRLGAGAGMLIIVYVIVVLAAVALPAYQDYTKRAMLEVAMSSSQDARAALGNYYEAQHKVPASLEAAGVPARMADGSQLSIDPNSMVLTVTTAHAVQLLFVPEKDDNGRIRWQCSGTEGTKLNVLPPACRR